MAVAFLGYAGLAYVGAVAAPPGVPRSNDTFSTVTWSQSQYGGTGVFRTVTVQPDGRYAERFAEVDSTLPPGRRGSLSAARLATLRELVTSRQLAAEQRRPLTYDCSDSSTVTVAMGEFVISALDCGNVSSELPTLARLNNLFHDLASPVNPSGGA